MSALPPKADIAKHELYLRFVPIADIALATLFWKEAANHSRRPFKALRK
jgi:hypothetical protein